MHFNDRAKHFVNVRRQRSHAFDTRLDPSGFSPISARTLNRIHLVFPSVAFVFNSLNLRALYVSGPLILSFCLFCFFPFSWVYWALPLAQYNPKPMCVCLFFLFGPLFGLGASSGPYRIREGEERKRDLYGAEKEWDRRRK